MSACNVPWPRPYRERSEELDADGRDLVEQIPA